ncbi:MAG: hypothetical protein ACK4UO_19430 [Pseudolabrys sp.]
MTHTVFRRLATAVLAAIAVLGLSATAPAVETSPVNGSVYIAGKPPIDPPPGAAKDSHAYLTIRGPGAVRIYRAMPAKAEDDLCRGDGWTIKRAGHFACAMARDGKKAECDFSVELHRGALDPGNPC